MDSAQIGVLVGGIILIIATLWFFFGPRASEGAKAGQGGAQEIEVVVKGGYSPDRIEVQHGRPVRLLFRREEATSCTEQVVLSDFGVSAMLPQGHIVPVEFTPQKAGEYTFHCGMNMVRGKLIVR